MKLPEICSIIVVFDLPKWVTDERYEYEKRFYYGPYHAWAGSYDRTEIGFNVVQDAIFELEIEATNWYPEAATVEVRFNCGLPALGCEIEEFQRDLAAVLELAKKLRGKTVYINKP